MYERSAIVLENYFGKILGFNKENNLKNNYENYNRMIDEIKEYQRIIGEEESVIEKFDESASEIEGLQSKEKKIHEINVRVEEERNELFNDLSENTSSIDQKLQKIEETIDKNNDNLKELREKYVKSLIIFIERQRERNKYARMHRTSEASYLSLLKQVNIAFEKFDYGHVKNAKNFIEDYKAHNEEIVEAMLKNGKNERVPFDEDVIRIAVDERSKIAKEEAELYISIYDRMKRLLAEVNGSGTVKLAKSEKLLRDVSVKLAFLQSKKDYIVVFLDNERMSAMNGKKAHSRLMEDACNNFALDIKQIDNLYELVKKETMGKATRKAYKELYNKTYLKEIEEKEKDFEEEATNIKINMGTIINSNYWRIEGIKNVYNTFQEEVSEKFDKDLSEYRIEEVDDIVEDKKETKKSKTSKETEKEKSKEKTRTKAKTSRLEELINQYSSEIDYEYDKNEQNSNDSDDYDEDYDEEDNDGYQDVVFDEEEEELENNYKKQKNDEEVEPYRYSYDDEDDDDDYDDYYDDEDEDYEDDEEEMIDDEDEITEEKIDQIIKNSRKGKNRKDGKQEMGLFGKLFKK